MKNEKVNKLLLEALEHEKGGVQIYETALRCAMNEDLKEEWQEYLEQTRNHVSVLQNVCEELGIDVNEETPGRNIVRHIGSSLVQAMSMALQNGRDDAEIVAAECVTLAETKDHLNWELIGEIAKNLEDDERETLQKAYDEVEDEEDEHLYHTRGWTRELHLQALGLEAVLPPPEEKKDVKTAIEAEEAKQSRKKMATKAR
jgi:ferritin-like metal-binding protein YciE